jgi:hypothetical protein
VTEADDSDTAPRDVRALVRFDLFLFTAVATVLVIRSALAVTGYPQVGSGGLHIAHVLWGGLLMAIAIVLVEILPGSKVRARAAFIGGIGFGLFIDEVGKFVTKDVNYFFKPAIAIIYSVFIAFYIVVREFVARSKLNDRRRIALVAGAVADLALGQLSRVDRDRALRLLDGVQDQALAAPLKQALTAELPRNRSADAWITTHLDRLELRLQRRLTKQVSKRLLLVVCAIEAADVILSAIIAIERPGNATAERTLLDTGLPGVVSAVLIVVAVIYLLRGHLQKGMNVLEWAIAVQLLLTQVVVFNREQWSGLAGFGASLVALWTLLIVRRAAAATRSDPTT